MRGNCGHYGSTFARALESVINEKNILMRILKLCRGSHLKVFSSRCSICWGNVTLRSTLTQNIIIYFRGQRYAGEKSVMKFGAKSPPHFQYFNLKKRSQKVEMFPGKVWGMQTMEMKAWKGFIFFEFKQKYLFCQKSPQRSRVEWSKS